MLETYVGVDKKTMNKFRQLNTRSVVIKKNYPMLYITDHEVSLLNDFDL